MYITKKHVSRRTVLRGMGVTVALPFLEAMVPAGTAHAKAAAGKVRLAAIEMVSYMSGPLLGHVEAGAVAALAGVQASIVSGGVLCVVAVIACGLALPRFRRYDARTHAPPPC